MKLRIQRKRTSGWRMPPNTTYVGQPSVYGNPWKVVESAGMWQIVNTTNYHHLPELYATKTAALEYSLLKYRNYATQLDLNPLYNRNLACWCHPDQVCHADVLLELANMPQPDRIQGGQV